VMNSELGVVVDVAVIDVRRIVRIEDLSCFNQRLHAVGSAIRRRTRAGAIRIR
jgi:hypothetical protein